MLHCIKKIANSLLAIYLKIKVKIFDLISLQVLYILCILKSVVWFIRIEVCGIRHSIFATLVKNAELRG